MAVMFRAFVVKVCSQARAAGPVVGFAAGKAVDCLFGTGERAAQATALARAAKRLRRCTMRSARNLPARFSRSIPVKRGTLQRNHFI